MGWRPKNVRESIYPMNLILAICGFTPFQYPIGRPRYVVSVIYTVISTTIYGFNFVRVIGQIFGYADIPKESAIICCVLCMNFAISSLAQFLNWYHGKKLDRHLNRIIKVDETLRNLGASFNYSLDMRYIIVALIYWGLSAICLNVLTLLWFDDVESTFTVIYTVLLIDHSLHMNLIVAINFFIAIKLIKNRLFKMNNILEELLTSINQRPTYGYARILVKNKIREVQCSTISNNRNMRRFDQRTNIVRVIKHIHLELVNIAKGFEPVYGIQMLMELAADFILTTGMLFTLYTMAIDSSPEAHMMRTLVLIAWLVISFTKLMLLSYISESVSAEAERTGDLIQCINRSIEDSALSEEIRQFTLQLMQNDLFFSVAEFFNLSFPSLRAFYGTVVTYLVILVQMSPVTDR